MTAAAEAAEAAHNAGLCVVPPRTDGTKRPHANWKHYQHTRPSLDQLHRWYRNNGHSHQGIGIICGPISAPPGHTLLMIELEAAALELLDPIIDAIEHAGHAEAFDNIVTGYTSESPSGGIHWLTWTPGDPIGNLKLARRPATPTELETNPDQPIVTLIETRGDGGYTIEPPTPGYTQIAGNWHTIATTPRHALQAILDTLTSFDQQPPPPAPPKPTPAPTAPLAGDDPAPWEAFNQTGHQILETAGFTRHSEDTKGTHYTRPGKNPKHGSSATVWKDNGRTTLWSTSIDAPPEALNDRRNLSPWQLHTFLNHNGDFAASAAAQRQQMPATPRRTPPTGVDPETGETLATDTTAHLPASFYTQTATLEHIRDAARNRFVAPDAVLGAVLAHLAAWTHPSTCLPATIGGETTLAVYIALLGRSGAGKSAPTKVARELIGEPPQQEGDKDKTAGPLTLGSGQGLAESFLEFVTEQDPDDPKKTRQTKRQTHSGILFTLDEGRALADLAAQTGSTIMSTLCSAWSSSDIGAANASQETRRILKAGGYTLGLISLWQPHHAEALIGDTAGGGPQRFIYLPTTDPDATTNPPDWPGPLNWQPPAIYHTAGALTIDPDIRHYIIDYHVTHNLHTQHEIEPLDAHRNLNRLKIAGLLAVLDCQRHINPELWDIAGQVMDVSDTNRNAIVAEHQARRHQEDAARRRAAASRAVAEQEAIHASAVRSMATSIHRRALRVGRTLTRSEAKDATARKHRKLASLDEAIEYGINEGLLEVGIDGKIGAQP